MRFVVVLGLPVLLLLAGAVYFSAKPSEDARIAAIIARADVAPLPPADPEDTADTIRVRQLLDFKNLTEDQITSLIGAAGRRYVRRKQAYEQAKQAVDAGRSPQSALEPLQKDMAFARQVCDFAESLGRRRDLTAIASADAELERALVGGSGLGWGLTDRYMGASDFTDADLKKLEKAFEAQFGHALPISAHGDSSAHRSLGFDHRGRVDVALSPLLPEGTWLRTYLSGKGFTFFAFSSAVRGKATGAHIHIGPPSGRIGHASAP